MSVSVLGFGRLRFLFVLVFGRHLGDDNAIYAPLLAGYLNVLLWVLFVLNDC